MRSYSHANAPTLLQTHSCPHTTRLQAASQTFVLVLKYLHYRFTPTHARSYADALVDAHVPMRLRSPIPTYSLYSQAHSPVPPHLTSHAAFTSALAYIGAKAATGERSIYTRARVTSPVRAFYSPAILLDGLCRSLVSWSSLHSKRSPSLSTERREEALPYSAQSLRHVPKLANWLLTTCPCLLQDFNRRQWAELLKCSSDLRGAAGCDLVCATPEKCRRLIPRAHATRQPTQGTTTRTESKNGEEK
eukprot:6179741-Pleurochrysis_carterae.AAC.4